MIENKNKKRANRGEFLQGGEPPLIGRARSSQKTSHFYDLFFVGNEFIFFKPHLPLLSHAINIEAFLLLGIY
jgi:hypothetical protein